MFNLKFIGQMDKTQICSLDDRLMGEWDGVGTGLYRKALSGKCLLQARYGHPRHTIKSIHVEQCLWVSRIGSKEGQFENKACILYQHFRSRGYPMWMLGRAYDIVKAKKRTDLLKKKRLGKFKRTHKLTLSTPYSLKFGQIRNIIDRYLFLLANDQICATLYKDGYKIVSRKAPTMASFLSPSFFNPVCSQSTIRLHFKGDSKCGITNCPCCSHILGGNIVSSTDYGTSHRTHSLFNYSTQ